MSHVIVELVEAKPIEVGSSSSRQAASKYVIHTTPTKDFPDITTWEEENFTDVFFDDCSFSLMEKKSLLKCRIFPQGNTFVYSLKVIKKENPFLCYQEYFCKEQVLTKLRKLGVNFKETGAEVLPYAVFAVRRKINPSPTSKNIVEYLDTMKFEEGSGYSVYIKREKCDLLPEFGADIVPPHSKLAQYLREVEPELFAKYMDSYSS